MSYDLTIYKINTAIFRPNILTTSFVSQSDLKTNIKSL